MLQSSKKFSLSLRQLFIYQHLTKGEGGGLQKRYIRFSHDCGFKEQNHPFTTFQGCGFNFTHFANFKFAYFETEVSFGLIWVNLKNVRFHLISLAGK